METRHKIVKLLRDYSVEDILERGDLDVVEALYLLVTYGALDLDNVIEGTDET